MSKKKARNDESCMTCKFFDIAFIEDEEDRCSWCMRFPPAYVGPPENTMGAEEFPSEFRYWEQPTVGIGQWCGEYKRRKEER